MSEQPLDGSRRALMQVVVGAISTALAFRMSQADASDKMTRQQAQYQDTPNGICSCGLCTLFERPNACRSSRVRSAGTAGARPLRWRISA